MQFEVGPSGFTVNATYPITTSSTTLANTAPPLIVLDGWGPGAEGNSRDTADDVGDDDVTILAVHVHGRRSSCLSHRSPPLPFGAGNHIVVVGTSDGRLMAFRAHDIGGGPVYQYTLPQSTLFKGGPRVVSAGAGGVTFAVYRLNVVRTR